MAMASKKTFLSNANYGELFYAWCNDTKHRPNAQDFESFRNKVMKHSSETAFVLRSNRVGSATMAALARILEEHPEVDTIDLHENVIRERGIAMLIHMMEMQPKEDSETTPPMITHLNVGSNDIGPDGAGILCEFLTSPMCQVKTLILGSEPNDLYANKLNEESGDLLATALESNGTVTHLDLNRNLTLGKKSQLAFRSLANALGMNRNLTTLCLGSTNISTSSASDIMIALYSYQNLSYLDLSSNNLKYEAAHAMGKMCTSSKCNIRTLLIQNNQFGSSGAQHLFVSLKQNNSLTRLNISNNNVYLSEEPNGIEALADLLTSPCELRSIDLSRNGIDHEGTMALSDALTHNSTLVHLNLSRNTLTNEGATTISRSLIGHQSLESLDLSSTGIGDEGAENIATSLAANQTMVHVNMNNNHLSNCSGDYFVKVLDKNTTLTSFEIQGNQIDHTIFLRVNGITMRNRRRKQEHKPNLLRKELTRLHYVEHKVNEINAKLRKQKMARHKADLQVQEVMDDIDQLVVLNESKIDEKQALVKLEKTLIAEKVQQTLDKRQEQRKFEESSQETINSMSAALEKDVKEADEQVALLKQFEEELDLLVNHQEEELDKIKKDLEEKREDLNNMTENMRKWKVETIELKSKIGKLEREVTKKEKIAEIDAKIVQEKAAKKLVEEQREFDGDASKNKENDGGVDSGDVSGEVADEEARRIGENTEDAAKSDVTTVTEKVQTEEVTR